MQIKEHIAKVLSRRSFLLSLGSGLGTGFLFGSASQPQANKALAARGQEPQFVYQSRHGGDHSEHAGPAYRAISSTTKKLDPMGFLKRFDYGQVTQTLDGRTTREYTMVAAEAEVEIAEDIGFDAWMFNGQLPGPTLRCTEGDYVRVRFINQTERRHSIHFHGIRPSEMDGVEPIRPGGEFVYEFMAEPFGLYPYHCHIRPVNEHIQRGLYGAFIVDPPTTRPPANEVVMVLNSYDLNSDQRNDVYSINGVAEYFLDQPIPIRQHELVRIYLINMVEFDPVVSLHLHANTADVYLSDGTLKPERHTDIITLGQAERAIVEFRYKFPGLYMFHPHQNVIAERGCVGFFEVLKAEERQMDAHDGQRVER